MQHFLCLVNPDFDVIFFLNRDHKNILLPRDQFDFCTILQIIVDFKLFLFFVDGLSIWCVDDSAQG